MEPMKQQSLGLGQSNKRTRRREFLSEMERVVPWSALVALVSPYMPEGCVFQRSRTVISV